jgi:putative transposase
MSAPRRNSSPDNIVSGQRTFFVTTSTDGKRPLFQTDRMATLLIEVMLHYRDLGEYILHDFVIMRDHLHAQVTIGASATIERVMQLIKGGFSYRAKKELGVTRTIWQRGFSEDRVTSKEEFLAFRKYIYENPVRAGMVTIAEEYPYSSANPKFKSNTAAAKAGSS